MQASTLNLGFALICSPCVGSFLSMLADRLPMGEPIAWSRSRCSTCARQLKPLDLIPFFSWALNRGQCRHCGLAISLFYPAVEVAALLVVAWAAMEVQGWLLWASCILGWILLAIALIDFRHFVIPDVLSYSLVIVGIVVATATHDGWPLDHIVGMLAGFAIFALIGVVYQRLRGRTGLGLGDAKLLAGAGAWLGWSSLPSVVLIATGLALAFVAAGQMTGRHAKIDMRIPFGPFLATALWLVWLYGPLEFAW